MITPIMVGCRRLKRTTGAWEFPLQIGNVDERVKQ
jgi:hypothetical protein